MKRIAGKHKFWAVLGAGLLVAVVSGSALARQIEDRDVLRLEVQKEQKSTTSASPLPTPTVQPAPEPENNAEFTGVVEVMASDSWVVGGQTVAVTAATEIKPGVEIGALVKVHVVRLADGSLWASEIETTDAVDHNSNDNQGNGNVNSNDANGNDDHGGNVNSNDSNSNDDHGGNSNVNSNDANGSDDHGGNSNVNSNDNSGSDDHSSHGSGG